MYVGSIECVSAVCASCLLMSSMSASRVIQCLLYNQEIQ